MTMDNSRIFTARDHFQSGSDHTVAMLYNDDDLSALVEWIDAGVGRTSETPHKHPRSAHTFVVLEGEGEALIGNGNWVKIQAGQFVINPRNKVHAMRNTSAENPLIWVCTGVGPHEVVETGETDE